MGEQGEDRAVQSHGNAKPCIFYAFEKIAFASYPSGGGDLHLSRDLHGDFFVLLGEKNGERYFRTDRLHSPQKGKHAPPALRRGDEEKLVFSLRAPDRFGQIKAEIGSGMDAILRGRSEPLSIYKITL